MSRNTEYEFIPTDSETVEAGLISAYEEITDTTVQPGSPVRLFIQWITGVLIQERVLTNYAANQNIPSRAEGENLDALGELFYLKSRPDPKAATCTMQFNISEAQASAVLISAGTRVTDINNTLVWETLDDIYVPIGETSVETKVQCQTEGVIGNGYAAGQLTKLIDVYPYYSTCTNTTESDGGSGTLTDTEFYELLRASEDAWSVAGPVGAYEYHAKQVSTEIADVLATSPTPGEVVLYTLMSDGTIATDEIKELILEACNADDVRPLTDHVTTGDPKVVDYSIDLTWYMWKDSKVSAAETAEAVEAAVAEYVTWQSEKLGRDINPSKLHRLIMAIDEVKRVEIRSPVFTELQSGDGTETPQIAQLSGRSVVNGGYESE